jgi:hypothetical protein
MGDKEPPRDAWLEQNQSVYLRFAVSLLRDHAELHRNEKTLFEVFHYLANYASGAQAIIDNYRQRVDQLKSQLREKEMSK